MLRPSWITGLLPAGGAGRWPSRCAICHHWPTRVVCTACLTRWGQRVHRCHACALPCPAELTVCLHCQQHPPRWHRALASLSYHWPWAPLVARFKYHAQAGWVATWAHIMRQTPEAADLLDRATWVLPMPMTAARWAGRGYHPAALLAQALGGDRCLSAGLMRWRQAPAQAGLPRQARWRNVANSMAVEPGFAPRLRGQPVLLIDDVMTTGASLDEATRAVLQAGARSVDVWVLARAEGPGAGGDGAHASGDNGGHVSHCSG